ncbi:DMT family transporter [Halovulum sp. GXIMD14793]
MDSKNLFRLAGLVFAAVSFVVVGDTAGKLLTARGVDPFFIAWTRFALAALVLLPFSGLSFRELPDLRDWRVLVRGMFIACGICCILTALRTEPIANVFGAFFVGPIVSYILAILFLGETPSQSRSILLAVGFAGVLLVVKPGFGISVGMVFALAAGGCYGAYLVMTRTVAGVYRPRFLLISQLIVGSVLLTPLGLSVEWPDFQLPILGLIALSALGSAVSALGSAVGNFLLVLANKSAEASLIAPLVYSQLLSATLAGFFVFGDWPDIYAFLGLVLIAFSGFGSLFLHQRQARAV